MSTSASDANVSHFSLRDSIFLLTGLLQGFSPSHSSESLTENVSRVWENLQSVTTLLTTGDPIEDCSGDRVVAATYSTVPDGIEALLFRNARPSDVNNALVAPQITSLIDNPVDDQQVQNMLLEWWMLRREDHERNLFHFLNFFIKQRRSGEVVGHFSRYIINMCYPEILARLNLESNQKLFACSPIVAFQEYAANLAPDAANPFPWALKMKGSSQAIHSKIVTLHCGLHPDPEGTFLVDRSNVVWYIDAMSNAFTKLGKLLRDEQVKQGILPKPKAHLSPQDVTAVLTQLHILAAFISLRFVEKMLSDQRVLNKICLLDPAAEVVGEFEESSDEDYSARRLQDEHDGAHIIRYLKSVTAWLPAMAVATTLPLEIHPHSILFPRPQIRHEDLRDGFSRVLAGISALEAASTNDSEPDFHDVETPSSGEDDLSSSSGSDSPCISALKTLYEAEYTDNAAGNSYREFPVLHAEAALMSIARRTRVGPFEGLSANKAVQMAFMGETTMIGVSKKCCWCCWKLRHLLNDDEESKLKLILPGTHSVISPWCPPDTIPAGILLRMEQELLEVLKELLDKIGIRKGFKRSSVRSSASSPPQYLIDISDPILMGEKLSESS